ncbi:MAG TPA: hypothetical protein VF279_07410, partial [Acidimicrobiales bacterium]
AIIPLKERAVDAKYDPIAWLGRKILNRSKRTPAEAAATSPASGPAAVQPDVEVHGIPVPVGITAKRADAPAPDMNDSTEDAPAV